MSTATTARPGTEEKVLVLIERYERGEELFHPDDLSNRTSMHELTGGNLRNGGLGGPKEVAPRNAMRNREETTVVIGDEFDDDDIMDDFGGEA